MSHTIEENVLAVAAARREAMDLTAAAGAGGRRGAAAVTADATGLTLADVANLISTSRWR